MPRCASCGRAWSDLVAACPHDGTDLGAPAQDGALAASEGGVEALVPDIAAGTMIGEYRVEGSLGRGGMAQVYAAVHPVIGKKAAIKVVSRELLGEPELIARFTQEARAVNRIGHPNIVDVFAFGTLPDGRPYYIMEWMLGEDLSQRLGHGPMATADSLDVLDQVAMALDAAHQADVIHRDVKPDNIYLAERAGEPPLVKLLDFGIAKLLQHEPPMAIRAREYVGGLRLTRVGMTVGTPEYVAPEQARGDDVGPPADVYSLGVVAYEMLTGRLPFRAASPNELIACHLSMPPSPLRSLDPRIPEALDALVIQMLAKDPAARPSLSSVRTRIDAIAGSVVRKSPRSGATATGGPLEPTLDGPLRTRRPSRMSRAVLAGSLPLLAVGASGLAIAWRHHHLSQNAAPGRARLSPAGSQVANVSPAVGATAVAILRVSCDVPAATVAIDGSAVGTDDGHATVAIATPGSHVLTVTAPGRRPYREAVAIGAGQTLDVAVKLQAAAARAFRRPAPSSAGSTNDLDYTVDPFK